MKKWQIQKPNPEVVRQFMVQSALSALSASVLAARITGYGITTPPETGPSLDIYDEAFLKGGNKAL